MLKKIGLCMLIAFTISASMFTIENVKAQEVEFVYDMQEIHEEIPDVPPSVEIITNAETPEIIVEEKDMPASLTRASPLSSDNKISTYSTSVQYGNVLDYGTSDVWMVDFNVYAMQYWDKNSDKGWRNDVIMEFYLNGQGVYCIEPDVITWDGESYTMGNINDVLTIPEQRKLGFISYFGYGYAGDTSGLMKAATTVAVWEARGFPVRYIRQELRDKVDELMRRVNTMYIRPSFEHQEITFTGYGKEHAVTLTDTNGVFHDYVIGSTGGYSVEKNGDNLTVWVERGATITGPVEYDRIDRTTIAPSIVYVSPNNAQKLMYIRWGDPATTDVKPSVALGSLKYMKKDSEGTFRQGTTINVYYADKPSSPVGQFTTGADGSVTVPNLEPTKVCFRETATTPDMVLDTTQHCVDVKGNETSTYTQTNTLVKGNIHVTKADSVTGLNPQGNATLNGAVYGLYAKDDILSPDKKKVLYKKDTLIDTQTIKNGTLDYTNKYLGTYYVQEITPSEGYQLDPTKYVVEIKPYNNLPIVDLNLGVKEVVKSQAFRIIKGTSDGSSTEIPTVQGAEFTVKLESDVQALGWDLAPVAKNADGVTGSILKTDKYGQAISDRYAYGLYRVRETKVPEDCLPTKDFLVEITENSNEPQQWRIFNDAPSMIAYVKLVKKDIETGKTIPVSNIEFKLKNVDTDEYVKQWFMYPIPHLVDVYKTGYDGTLTTPQKMLPGNYQWEEISSPDGYVLGIDPIPFKIEKDSAYQVGPDGESIVITVDVYNKQQLGKITINKQAEIFKGYDFRNTEYGKIYEPLFENGSLDEVTYELEAKEDIITPDGTVWHYKGDIIDTKTSTDGTPFVFDNLRLGSYEYTETHTKNGYVLDTTSYEVDIEYEGQEVEIVEKNEERWNDRQRGYVEFEKVFDESLFLNEEDFRNDVVYGLYTAEPLIVDGFEEVPADSLLSVTTLDEINKARMYVDLPCRYYVQEITTHEKLILDDTKHYFSFEFSDENTKETKLEFEDGDSIFENHLKRGSLIVYKTNENAEPLKGAEFAIASDNLLMNIVKTDTTDEVGNLSFNDLEYGDYWLYEKAAPDGHEKDLHVYHVVIDEEHQEVSLNIVNQKIEVPQTSDSTNANLFLFGALVFAVSVVALSKLKRK